MWDLSNLLSLQAFIQYIKDDSQRVLAQTIVARFTAQVLPVQAQLPTAVAQNDANDHNIVVDSSHQHVAALLDFGDMVCTARVNELAICVAYGELTALLEPAHTLRREEGGIQLLGCSLLLNCLLSVLCLAIALLEKDDIMPCASSIIATYTQARPLTAVEATLLHTLVASRLCQSVIMSAYSYSQDPGNEYLLVTAKPGWKTLGKLMAMSEAQVTAFNALASVE